jgi:hypothetical protein
MNEYQFRMDGGECADDRFEVSAPAGGEHGQGVFLEVHHQVRNLTGRREGETVFVQIDHPVFPGPRVNRAKPDSMYPADIVCRKPMISVIAIDQLRHRAQLFHQLDSVHLALAGDAEEIP